MLKKRETISANCTIAATVAFAIAGFCGASIADEGHGDHRLYPGNLLVSRVVYDNNPNNISVGQSLPPNCVAPNCVKATANGAYPAVFNNVLVDGSFGITTKIVLDQYTPWAWRINSIEVPNSSQRGVNSNSDQMVTSFPSKSEVGLNLSLDRKHVTFMGYYAPVDAVDASNSNTLGVIDSTNPVPAAYYRVVADLDQTGNFHFTATNAYSGNNGRSAILVPDPNSGLHPDDRRGHGRNNPSNLIYASGNAGNGSNPQPNGILLGAGAQILTEATTPLVAQNPGLPTPVGSFNITQLGDKADKLGKDDNFRGLTIYNNVVYYTKGSGGNGVNTVYFIDASGTDSNGQPLACPKGVGVPNPNAGLPTTALQLQGSNGLPNDMCVLSGFNTTIAKNTTDAFPFGLWFANPTTLYVADEGNGSNKFDPTQGPNGTYTDAAKQTKAGLQKWVFDKTKNAWVLAYVLQQGLGLGAPYTVPGYPTGNNAATNLPWAPATDGLRNLTGRVNRDGTVTIWAVTSTVSGGGDQGADPNRFVTITDNLAAQTLPAGESFQTIAAAGFAEAYRGVSFTPGTGADR
jgi:hypothetical protein